MKSKKAKLESFLKRYSIHLFIGGFALCATILLMHPDGVIVSLFFDIGFLLLFFGSFQKKRIMYLLILVSIPVLIFSPYYWHFINDLPRIWHFLIVIPVYVILLRNAPQALYPKYRNNTMFLLSLLIILAIAVNEIGNFCWAVSYAEKGIPLEDIRFCKALGFYHPHGGFGHPIGSIFMHLGKIVFWTYISLPIVFLINFVLRFIKLRRKSSKNQSTDLAVLGIVVRNSKVLIVKRKKIEVGKDGVILAWGFPGGKTEADETLEDAVIREMYEETGYRVLVDGLISKRDHPDYPVKAHYFSCLLTDNDRDQVDDKNTIQHKWIAINEMGEYLTSVLDPKVKQYIVDQSS